MVQEYKFFPRVRTIKNRLIDLYAYVYLASNLY